MPPSVSHSMYYAAIVCPERVNEKILLFKNHMKAQFGCTVALKSPAHITLVAPFWFENDREKELSMALRSFWSEQEPFEINLDGFDHFNKRVLFVSVNRNPALKLLKEELEWHLVSVFTGRIEKEDRPFHPHVTIAGRDMQLSHFEKAWTFFSKKEFSEKFIADSVSLLKLVEGKWTVISERIWFND